MIFCLISDCSIFREIFPLVCLLGRSGCTFISRTGHRASYIPFISGK